MKKFMGCIIALAGVIAAVTGIAFKYKAALSVSIIGGADGPTSIFLAGKVTNPFSTAAVVIGILLLAVGIVIAFRRKK